MMMRYSSALRRLLGCVHLTILLGPLVLAGSSYGARIRVAQESRARVGDFQRHILGHVGPLAASPSAEEAYAYNEHHRFSFNGRQPVLRVNVSHLFFIETPQGLTLFVVHDSVDDPDGGSASMRFQVVGNRRQTRLLLRDDAFSPNDSYDANSGGTDFRTSHNWHPCCTDGLVLGPLSGPWKVYLEFTGDGEAAAAQAPRGLQIWEAVSDRRRIPLALETGRRVLLEPVDTFVFGPSNFGADLTAQVR